MRLTKKQLKRIIREEYSRLKRRGLISEGRYQHNDAMGGPEDQSFPPGTTVAAAAAEMVEHMKADYPGVFEQLQEIQPSTRDLEMMNQVPEDQVSQAVAEALEYMDIDGSGNFEYRACLSALEQAINGRRGRY